VAVSRRPVHRGAYHESQLDSSIRGDLGRWAAIVSVLLLLGFHNYFAIGERKHVAVSRRPVIRGVLGGWAAIVAVQLLLGWHDVFELDRRVLRSSIRSTQSLVKCKDEQEFCVSHVAVLRFNITSVACSLIQEGTWPL